MPSNANTIAAPKRLAIGVVGLGRIGRQHALNALHRVRQTSLICACSPADADHAWAAEHLLPYGVPVYRTLEEMLQAHAPTSPAPLAALLIASTTTVHHEQVLTGMRHGLHMLVEKPLAMNTAQSRHIQSLAADSPHRHLQIMTAFSRRHDASYQRAARAIAAGTIGAPVVIRCENRDMYDRSDFYMRYVMANPGIFIDTAVHDIDLTLSFLGAEARPKSAYAVGTIALHGELAEIGDVDNAVGTVEWYASPTMTGTNSRPIAPISHYTVSRIMRHGFDNPTEIIGTKGVIKVNMHPRRDLLDVADERGLGNDVMPDFYERYEKAFVTELEVFADAVLEGKNLPYGLEVAVKGMEIAEALQESLRTGKKIEWDETGKRRAGSGDQSKL